MKKKISIPSALLIACMSLVGCHNGKTAPAATAADSDSMVTVTEAPAATSSDTLQTQTVEYAKYEKDSLLYSKVSVQWPTGNDSLSLGVRSFIAGKLAKIYLPHAYYYDGTPNLSDYPLYKGDLSDARALVKHYGKGTLRYLRSQWEEMEMDSRDSREHIDNEITIYKEKETPRYVVYLTTTYCELGGPHGNYECVSNIISKFTHREVTDVLLKGKEKQLQPFIRKGILDYFNQHEEGEEVDEDFTPVTDEELEDRLNPEVRGKLIPLPENPPTLDTDGVWLEYQRGEILPYAEAIVGIKIPYKDIKPYLTKEARQLFGD